MRVWLLNRIGNWLWPFISININNQVMHSAGKFFDERQQEFQAFMQESKEQSRIGARLELERQELFLRQTIALEKLAGITNGKY